MASQILASFSTVTPVTIGTWYATADAAVAFPPLPRSPACAAVPAAFRLRPAPPLPLAGLPVLSSSFSTTISLSDAPESSYSSSLVGTSSYFSSSSLPYAWSPHNSRSV